MSKKTESIFDLEHKGIPALLLASFAKVPIFPKHNFLIYTMPIK